MDANIDECMDDFDLVNRVINGMRSPRTHNCLRSLRNLLSCQSGRTLKDNSYCVGAAGEIEVVIRFVLRAA
jgi:hypothetical protein